MLFLQVFLGLIYIILENEVKSGEGGPIFMYRHFRKQPGEAVLQLRGESTLLGFYPRSWVDYLCVFSHSVMSNSLQLFGLQHARLPHASPSPGACSNSVHWVGDAIQPSHLLLYPSPPAFNLAQHQGLPQWISSLHQVAKVLELRLQHQSFQWIFRTDFL